MAISIAVNGFGRIGRAFIRALLADPIARKRIHLKAINLGPTPIDYADLFLRYDTTMRTLTTNTITRNGTTLTIDNHDITLLTETEPAKLAWKQLGIDVVVECSGKFTTRELAMHHVHAGANKVVISAPSNDADCTIIHGLNNSVYDASRHTIISLASCTTNCFAPLIEIITKEWSLVHGAMTTVHAYTNDQLLVDGSHHDPRRARSGARNIIPTKTGADKAIIQLYPHLEGRLMSSALRVPVEAGSLIDFSFVTQETLSVDQINNTFKRYAQDQLHGVITYSTDPIVSSDCIANTSAAIFDSLLTKTTGTMNSIYAWYDNEFGYAARMASFIASLEQ